MMQPQSTPPSGILPLRKSPGVSSHRALAPLKRQLQTRKVGHSGTLDPFASGLLIALVGTGTRIAEVFLNLSKCYRATVRFGVATDTLDPQGTVVASGPIPTDEAVQSALSQFRGTISQQPPQYSALKVAGRRAYARARSGETFELAHRSVHVSSILAEPLDLTSGLWHLELCCSSGTYVRSIARDLAHAVGTVAHLTTLERVSVGPFGLQEAVEPEQTDRSSLIDLAAAVRRLGNMAVVVADDRDSAALADGAPLRRLSCHTGLDPAAVATGLALVVDRYDRELALLAAQANGQWRYRAVFARNT